MVEMICFVGNCSKVKASIPGKTARIERYYKNGKLFLKRRKKELLKMREEKYPHLSFKEVEKRSRTISVKIEEVRTIEEAKKIMEKYMISPKSFLVITVRENKKIKGKFYDFNENSGWIVSLPDSSEKYIQELIGTFFLNFKEEKERKLKGLL